MLVTEAAGSLTLGIRPETEVQERSKHNKFSTEGTDETNTI